MTGLERIDLEGTIWQLQQDIGAANVRIGRHEKAIQAEREIVEAAQQRLTAARFQLLSQEYGVDLHVGAEVVMTAELHHYLRKSCCPLAIGQTLYIDSVNDEGWVLAETPSLNWIYIGIPATLIADARKLWLQQQETKP